MVNLFRSFFFTQPEFPILFRIFRRHRSERRSHRKRDCPTYRCRWATWNRPNRKRPHQCPRSCPSRRRRERDYPPPTYQSHRCRPFSRTERQQWVSRYLDHHRRSPECRRWRRAWARKSSNYRAFRESRLSPPVESPWWRHVNGNGHSRFQKCRRTEWRRQHGHPWWEGYRNGNWNRRRWIASPTRWTRICKGSFRKPASLIGESNLLMLTRLKWLTFDWFLSLVFIEVVDWLTYWFSILICSVDFLFFGRDFFV